MRVGSRFNITSATTFKLFRVYGTALCAWGPGLRVASTMTWRSGSSASGIHKTQKYSGSMLRYSHIIFLNHIVYFNLKRLYAKEVALYF